MTEANLQSAALTGERVVVFSDLDGALLDHDGYSFEAAKPALAALAKQGIPVVAISSKTLCELEAIAPEMGLSEAMIAENGAVIKFSDGIIDRAVNRVAIWAVLDTLSEDLRSSMQCFCDMQTEEISNLTGLDNTSAERAAMREASEPFLWHGDEAGLEMISAKLALKDLQVVQGGRFFHIVPPRDKAAAMNIMLAQFEAQPDSWALGDGPNDVAMLLAATRGALIANPHLDTQSLLPEHHCLYLSSREGAAGWCDAIAVFLDA